MMGILHIKKLLWTGAVVVLAGLLTSTTLWAQAPEWNPERLELSRADLQDLLVRLEAVETSSAYGGDVRQQARDNIARIRQRLDEGDFRVGDAVILEVEAEPQLSDSLPVQPGPVIRPADIGPISLKGVLRSELVPHLTKEIGRYVRNPVVRARSMVRISVQGTVTSPGYYLLPAGELLSQAIMRAGGPATNADINQMRVERAQRIVWEGARLQEEIAAGRTIDQLGLLAGDQLFVPEIQTGTGWGDRSLAIIGVIGSLATTWVIFR
ncbi:MAG: polysaccharide biosynthesis/export family protein [Longimicrobiales bacterium]